LRIGDCQGDEDCSDPHASQRRDHEVNRVWDQKSNTITFADSTATQGGTKSSHLIEQLRVGQLSVKVLNGLVFRIRLSATHDVSEHA
jgi:hypothetical protein